MKAYLEDFIRYLQIDLGRSQNTLVNYRQDLEKLAAFINRKELIFPDQINQEILRQYYSELAQMDYATASVQRINTSMRQFFKYLQREGVIQDNPMAFIESPKREKRLPKS